MSIVDWAETRWFARRYRERAGMNWPLWYRRRHARRFRAKRDN